MTEQEAEDLWCEIGEKLTAFANHASRRAHPDRPPTTDTAICKNCAARAVGGLAAAIGLGPSEMGVIMGWLVQAKAAVEGKSLEQVLAESGVPVIDPEVIVNQSAGPVRN